MDPGKIFQIITNSTLLATRLLSGEREAIHFSEARYCSVLTEDTPPSSSVVKVSATHKGGALIRYSITGGNKDGLFTIDQHTGLITLSANLDYELQRKHELVVAAEAEGSSVHSFVAVSVADVNDNPPQFTHNDATVTILEGESDDLPKTIFKVVAEDADSVDAGRLIYSVGGEGVSTDPSDKEAFFSINPHSGEVLQLRALDRDPPNGKASWQLRVQVRDGQRVPSSLAEATRKLQRKIYEKLKKQHEQKLKQEQEKQKLDQQEKPNSPASLVISNFINNLKSTSERISSNEQSQLREKRSNVLEKDANRNNSTLTPNMGLKVNDDQIERLLSRVRQDKLYTGKLSKRLLGKRIYHIRNRKSTKTAENNVNKPSESSLLQQELIVSPFQNATLYHSIPTSKSHLVESINYSGNTTYNQSANMRAYHPNGNYSDVFSSSSIHPSISDMKMPKLLSMSSVPKEDESLMTKQRNILSKGYPNQFKRSLPSGFLNEKTQLRSLNVDRLMTRSSEESTTTIMDNKQKDLKEGKDIDDGKHQLFSGRRFSTFTSDDIDSCEDYTSFSFNFDIDDIIKVSGEGNDDYDEDIDFESDLESHLLGEDDDSGRVHVVETVVTVVVKDLNDNPPLFPNVTIVGEVQENGPIDLSVASVSAWDADDVEEGTNARLTYSIGKNVLEERSGQPIFAIDPDSGLLTTVVCCLDRETTPHYHIQVVAVDGGGLTGTGQVLVRLTDVNDNAPRLSRDHWEVDVQESWTGSAPNNKTLVQLTTVDFDISNYFFYRVVEDSGWGWQYFDVRSRGHVGELYSTHPLDYEDSSHRRGFRFMIQVTDRGRGGWDEPRHTDSAWVSVKLLDINDNPPQFSQPQIHLTLQENVAPGTTLTNLIAQDPDMGGLQEVKYSIVGGWGALTVNTDGVVRLWRSLDREMPGGDVGVAKVIAVDDGEPAMTSTATLTITVTDVNDCPPRLLPPTLLHVVEGRPATKLSLLRATDDDVWALGHGPPFFFSLPSTNPPHLFHLLALRYNSSEDSGRGGAELWTRGSVDREEYPQLVVEIEVSDAGGLSTTQPVTIIVDDINDNPMKPAAKTVYLWKTQGAGSEASLGRVYVEDPDDWDLADKTFSWVGPAHSLFSLNEETGAIFASAHVREGRYDLQFSVSDPTWGQIDVRANVTVDVRYLHPDAITHALPITLTPITPTDLTTGWSPKRGGGGLGILSNAVKDISGISSASVDIVSVYGHPESEEIYSTSKAPEKDSLVHFPVPSFTCVWLSVKENEGKYMDPVKLHGILALNNRKLEKIMSVGVSLREPTDGDGSGLSMNTPLSVSNPQQPSSLASLASTSLPLQVVDTNTTSLVTPRLTRSYNCPSHFADDSSDSCTRTSCLNGGRCVRTTEGKSRCICPGGSWGRRCKILSRSFEGNGWVWIRPFTPCLPTTISLKVLTNSPNALLMYSGPLSFSSTHPRYPTTPMMTLQLMEGRPQLLMESSRGSIKIQIETIFEIGIWHTLHIHIDAKGVTLMADLCSLGWAEGAADDSHCISRESWENPNSKEDWLGNDPVQLGGLSHSRPSPQQFGWNTSPINHSLKGCISHLKLNGQLIDLGEPAYSTNSWPGCAIQESACNGICGFNGRCTGGLANPWCDCEPGWTPPICDKKTISSSFSSGSYLKLAISFTPDPYSITSQLRVRALGRPDGLLMKLENRHHTTALVIRLREGVVCASFISNDLGVNTESCIDGYPLGDGSWHTVYAERHGPNILLSVDDGDGWKHNLSLPSFPKALPITYWPQDLVSSSQILSLSESTSSSPSPFNFEKPVPLYIDKQNGVSIGGVPDYEGTKLLNISQDLHDICIEDIRVSGKGLPLPPAVNGSSWAQVTTFRNLENDCAARDLCSNKSCMPPLSCHNSWRQASCSCGPGRQLIGGSCQMVNECIYHPCLHGGTCHDIHPGYRCSCQLYHSGDNCQWVHLPAHTHNVTPVVIAAITLSILVFVVIGVVVTLRLHKSRAVRNAELRPAGVECSSEVGGMDLTIESPLSPTSYRHNEEPVMLDAMKLKVQVEQHAYQDEKSPSLSCKGGGNKDGYYHTSSLKRSFVGHGKTSDEAIPSNKLPPRVTLCSTKEQNDPSYNMRRSPSDIREQGVGKDYGKSEEEPKVALICGKFSTYHPPAQDDLRAYAYEGDGSPTGSLTSATIGLQMELREDEDVVIPLVPEYGEVLNILSTLPDAPYTKIVSPNPLNISSETGMGSSTSIRTISGIVSSPEKLNQNKRYSVSLEEPRGSCEVLNKQGAVTLPKTSREGLANTETRIIKEHTHTRRKSSIVGLSTSC